MAVCLRVPFFFCMLLAFFTAASSQLAPAPAVDCSTLVLTMVDCLSFVTEGSKLTKPEGQCCSGLKNVLKTKAECLCETFRNSAQLGVKLNVSKAATLPAACSVSAPSISNCGLSIGSGAAPALSPLAISPSSVAGAPATSIGVNAISPAPAPQNSGSSSYLPSTEIFVFGAVVFTASFAVF
ncbi:non-specific lipid transfer protein GPI-anchored 31-like isoform X1 [Primulina eburnea]|uniref:non-specific lipid transfer protein GPI-anchored 31-like isoform X1 n=1 Tax=Primulina eburnea TaxID=1245227 RepID=UPI003C6C9ED8